MLVPAARLLLVRNLFAPSSCPTVRLSAFDRMHLSWLIGILGLLFAAKRGAFFTQKISSVSIFAVLIALRKT
jgi:hypothetical protein